MDSMPISFEAFVLQHAPEITKVQRLLSVPLSDNPAVMNEQVREIEAWYGRMTSLLAFADGYLDAAEQTNLQPKSKDVTDIDRSTALAAAVARERRFRDIASGLCEAIRQRVILAQALMKANSAEGRMAA